MVVRSIQGGEMLDWIGDVAWSVAIYQILDNLAGTLLIVLATLGVVLFLWKHTTGRYAYRFSFRSVVDLWVMVMISGAGAAGVYLLMVKGG